MTGLLYVGAVLLEPAPLPSLEDVLLEEETREETRRELPLAQLEGRCGNQLIFLILADFWDTFAVIFHFR